MVDSQVRPNDVPNLKLQKAMETIPRENFVPTNRQPLAYAEMDIPLFEGRKLLQARDFSKMVQELDVRAGDLVLDIGCGFGYSTAVLSHLAGMVVAVEDNEAACTRAEEALQALEIDNAAVICAPLTDGVPGQGPYNRILINGVVDEVPQSLLTQLADGGHLMVILRDGEVGHATLFTRSGDSFGHRFCFEAAATWPLPTFVRPRKFQF